MDLCCAQDLASQITSPGPAGTPQAPCADARNRSPLELMEGHTRGRGGGHTFPPSLKVAPGPAERTRTAGLGGSADGGGQAAHVPWSRLVSVCRGGVRARAALLWGHEAGAQSGQRALHVRLPGPGRKSQSHSPHRHVNCLIYLVCSTARLGPTTPNSCGDRRGGTSRTPCCWEPRARARTLHT